MGHKKQPKIGQKPQEVSKSPKIIKSPDDLYRVPICWKIGNLDVDGMWGVSSIVGGVSFEISEQLLESIAKYNNDSLLLIIEELSSRTHTSHSALFENLHKSHDGEISTDLIKQICNNINYESKFNEIHSKMKHFENLSWSEIDAETSGKKSKHHNISIDQLSSDAKKRLEIIGFGDLDEIYSLRLAGKLRVFGRKIGNVLDIIWIDPNHEICPSNKKHT